MARYYKLVTNRFTIGECWRLAKDLPEFWTYLKMRFMLPPLPQEMGQGRPDSLDIVDTTQVPTHVRRHIDPIVQQFEQLGFYHAFYYTIPMIGRQEGYVSACLGRDTRMAAAATYARQRTEIVEMEHACCSIATQLRDGRIIATSNVQPTLDPPPTVESIKLPGQNAASLLARHSQRLESVEVNSIAPIATVNELQDFSLHMNQIEIDDFIRRGVYALMSDAEVAAVKAKSAGNF